ncbi:uncharacterized protein LOC122326419 [Puntigrus tetrazona]|uniref:uncharacterized protein LOC122326418 n=1 Tax=Puntigrus tetrazona TaxID=1606681 RepID=UPI001C8962D4|nr:uncharacterized protein LOC122326418 [Puntigrus tetrazona]XP_043077219.1 uncharacterized protein LOC122326419 [Puntigrus tetrazona]
MASSGSDSVWIGFMDIVPVIGTLRESVELVLALYEGNEALVKEKEKAIENIVKEPLLKQAKKMSAPLKSAPAAEEFSGLRNIREVRKDMIIEYMMKGSKREQKAQAAQQKARQKKVDDIKKKMLVKIQAIDRNCNEVLIEEVGKSKRGEHVFNNNILKFHSKVLKDFIENKIYNEQAVATLTGHTLPPNTAEDIQRHMVVHFEDELYVNANAVTYGRYCAALRDAMLRVLSRTDQERVTQNDRQQVNHIINNMNNHQVYVDELAKEEWIRQDRRGARQARFEEVRLQVVNMYENDRGLEWCLRVLREVPRAAV